MARQNKLTLHERVHEHSQTNKEGAVYKHIRTCNHLGTFAEKDLMDLAMYNTNVIDSTHHWNVLLYRGAIYLTTRVLLKY